MIRALVFAGAFNPPTLAHLELAKEALSQTDRTCVVFVPSQSRYISEAQGKDFAFSGAERLAMLEACAKARPWMRVCAWELEQPEQPRTYRTLCHLRETGIEGALLLGSDKLRELSSAWRHVPEIAREFGIVCMSRGEDDCGRILEEDPVLSGLRDCIQLVRTEDRWRGVSSSEVRRQLRTLEEARRQLGQMLPTELYPLAGGALAEGAGRARAAGSVPASCAPDSFELQ